MRMHSGHVVDLANPHPEDIRLDDVAYHLAHITRWTGAGPFTDAQHCVMVSHLVPWYARHWGFLHDAEEAYVGDVGHSLKGLLGSAYTDISLAWRRAVSERFEIPECDVKQADDEAALIEATWQWPHLTPADVGLGPFTRPVIMLQIQSMAIDPLSARDAEELFLARARHLGIK
jgi:hypothetical protein